MKLFLTSILFVFIYSCAVSEKVKKEAVIEYPSPSSDWAAGNCPCKEVSIYLMEGKEPPAWFNLEGEATLKLSSNVKSMDLIFLETIEKMKNRVKEANGCVVFVDLRDYYGSEMFPMREKNEVYFYWGTCK